MFNKDVAQTVRLKHTERQNFLRRNSNRYLKDCETEVNRTDDRATQLGQPGNKDLITVVS